MITGRGCPAARARPQRSATASICRSPTESSSSEESSIGSNPGASACSSRSQPSTVEAIGPTTSVPTIVGLTSVSSPVWAMTSTSVAALSTVVEWYDFTLYLYFATVLSRIFFVGEASLGATLAAFAAAYLLRPLGAVAFGHIGDRFGRSR